MKKLLVMIGFLSLVHLGIVANAGASPTAAKAATTLDGKVFTSKVGEKGSKKGDSDDISFTAGNFHSSACDQYGFKEAPYSAKDAKSGTSFEALTKNSSGDTIEWTG